MNILSRYRHIFTIFVVFLACSECFPYKHKKTGNHRRTARSHFKGHGHGKSTKKDSVRPSRQEVMAAVMHPGKLDMREEKELSQLQDFNKEYINNEMAAETSLLANQGIDDDSALRISNIEALPGALRGAYASPKPKFNDMKDDSTSMSKQNVAGFNPDEYMLDANSWPEYKIKDSDYMSKNFRVFPQGQNEGEGGFQGGMMPYGTRGRMEEGVEGPYGDGNYGFPQPPQMVSDQPSPPPQMVSDQPSPPQMPDEGSQTTSMPMNEANKVQRLVLKNNKHKNPAGENFNDQQAGPSKGSADKGLLHSGEGGSGSGEGSGSSNPNGNESKAPLNPKGASDTPKPSNMKSHGKVGGKGEVGADVGGKGSSGPSTGEGGGGGGGAGGGSGDTAGSIEARKTGSGGTGGVEASATGTKAKSESSQILSSQPKPEPPATDTKTPIPEKVKQTADKTQNPTTNDKNDSTNGKNGSNASNGTPDANPSNGSSTKDITNTLSQGNTPLGQFAEFLKSKGITLTINKDKASANTNTNDAQTPDKQSQSSSTTAQSAPPPESMLASVLPTTGESLAQPSSNTNSITKINGSQDSQAAPNNIDNAVMNWQNIAPQNAGQLGQLFLRQSTKQGHH